MLEKLAEVSPRLFGLVKCSLNFDVLQIKHTIRKEHRGHHIANNAAWTYRNQLKNVCVVGLVYHVTLMGKYFVIND